jgi:murein DD-endopeptidase MepM/ murein hydrolase activator NlpD/uncharacterized protein YqgC (DUF456 family)
MSSIKNDKLKEQAERRRLRREQDAAREDEIENRPSPGAASGIAKTGTLTGKDKSWGSKLFESLFGGFGGLLAAAAKFLISLVTFAAVRTILQIVGDPENKKKMELFLTKLQFVWNKISAFTSWLVQDNLLDGFTSLFGEDSTFGDRLQGLGKILIGIIGLKLLLDPFGLIFGVLDLLNARERAAGAPQVPGVDPSAQTPGGSKNPKTQTKIPPTRKRDIILKRSRVDRLSRLKTSLQRIKAKQAGIFDYARVGIRRPGRVPGFINQGLKQTPRMLWRGVKGIFSGAKGFFSRIPVVGTLIHFALSILDVDDQGNIIFDIKGKGEKAAYQSIGGAIGAAAGSFLPVPIIGTIVGSLIGQFGGELIYDMVKGAGKEATFAKMKAGWNTSIERIKSGAEGASNWVSGAWNQWYRGVDKVKFPDVPDWIKNTPGIGNWVSSFPIWGMMVPDPRVITDPMKIGFTYGMNFFKSLFGGVVQSGKTTFLPGANRPAVGQKATLGGKSVVWDGNNWVPEGEDNPYGTATPPVQQSPAVPDSEGSVDPGVSTAGGKEKAILDLIASVEAPGYDAVNGTAAKKLTECTIREIASYAHLQGRSGSGAAGRYQHMPAYIAGRAVVAGFNADTKFTPGVQDKITIAMLNAPPHNMQAFLAKRMSAEAFGSVLAGTWRGFPQGPINARRLGGTEDQTYADSASGRNAAKRGFKWKDFLKKLKQIQGSSASISAPDTTPPGPTPQDTTPTPGMQIGGGDAPISSGYGTRTHPVTGEVGSHHGGIDIAVPSGTYIAVKEPGEVMGAGTYGNYGQVVDIWIPSRGIQLRFAHLSQLLVRTGTKVEAYTPIARSGGGINDPGRGRSTGPHIHFEADTQKDGRTGGGSGNPKSYLSLIHLTKDDPRKSTKVTGKVDTAAPTGQANTVPGRPIGQKATLNGQPVVWDGRNWIPDTKTSVQLDPMAALLKGVLALPRQQKGLSPVPEDSKSAFIKGVTDGTFKLYLAPDGLPLAGAALNAGGSLVDAAGNIIGGLFGGGGSSSDGGGGGGGGAGSSDGSGINLPKNPFDEAYSKPELDDPIADYLKLAYGDIPADGPSGNPFSQPLTKEGILNNFYGYNPLSLKDGWEIFKAKLGLPGVGSPKPKEEPNESSDVKTSDIDFSNLFNFSSGGQLPNNLPQAFLGKVFKSVGKAISGAFNGIKKAVSSVGNAIGGFLNSPIGQVVGLGLSFIPGVAPIMAGIRAVVALSQGDIMGAIVGGMGALGGMFPGTFGAEGTFFAGLNSTFGDGLGGVMKGFLTGGFGGALGALPGMLPQGMQSFFQGVGGFLEENQGVAKIAQMLPGVMASTGFGQMLGLPDPQAMGGMGSLQEVFQEGNATGILAAVMGQAMGNRSFQDALTDISAELGVDPTVLGGQMSRSRMRNPMDEKSRELALQTKIEVQQVPIVVEKLVAIPKGVPINNYVRVPVRVPVAQPQQ